MTDLLTANGYRWPGQFTPFSHQVKTSEFLIRNKRCFCFNGIGSGKTMSALWAADFLMSIGAIKKVLIVSPLSTLKSVWADEIYRNFVNRSYSVLYGSRAKRRKLIDSDVDFYIVNFEGVGIISDKIKNRDDIGLVIVDEGAILRNARTIRWKEMLKVAGESTGRGINWMTGAPIPNGPEGAWSQVKLVNPDNIHKYYTRYRDEMMRKIDLYRWLPVHGWEDKCYSYMQPSIRFKTEDCIDLPPCTTQSRVATMGANQKKAYEQMKKDFVAQLNTGNITALNEGAKCIKLLQIAAGAVYDSGEIAHYLDPKPKLTALDQSIQEAGNKAIVFVPFRHSIPLLKSHMESKGLTVSPVYGDVAVRDRADIFRNFQQGDLNIILAHPGTLSHGLTLTASRVVIWWCPVNSYETYQQANGRITRPGQKHKQTIVHLSCSEIETKVYQRLRRKEKMQGVLLELLGEK